MSEEKNITLKVEKIYYTNSEGEKRSFYKLFDANNKNISVVIKPAVKEEDKKQAYLLLDLLTSVFTSIKK